jgi:ribonuclease HII
VIDTALEKVCSSSVSKDTMIFLDGSLKAGDEYPNQETVIKGDETIIEISLASIIAKVYRDDLMKKVALIHPEYGFERHVGYGTKAHYEAIVAHGMTEEHRRSFLKNFTSK